MVAYAAQAASPMRGSTASMLTNSLQLNFKNTMIYQVPLDLDIENKAVQVVIDFETGFVGFSERLNEETIEYYFGESPTEFKTAFLKKIEPLMAEKSFGCFKTCRKDEKMKQVQDIISKK